MRPRVAHGVRMSGAPRRSRSQQPVLDATPPPAPLHRAEALELGNLNRLNYLVVSPEISPGWSDSYRSCVTAVDSGVDGDARAANKG